MSKVDVKSIRPVAISEEAAKKRIVYVLAYHSIGFIKSVADVPNLAELARGVVEKDWSHAITLGLGKEYKEELYSLLHAYELAHLVNW